MYEIPYDEEIVHKTHLFYDGQLVSEPFPDIIRSVGVSFRKSLLAKHGKVIPGRVSFGQGISRELWLMEPYLHFTPLGDFSGPFHRLGGIGKKPPHLFFGLYIIPAALIAHPVRIRKPLSRLEAQQYVMGVCILRVCVMAVIGHDQVYPRLFGQAHQTGIYFFLVGKTVVLHLEKIISLPEHALMPQRSLPGILIPILQYP